MASADKETEAQTSDETLTQEETVLEGELETADDTVDSAETEGTADVTTDEALAAAQAEVDKFRDMALRAEAEMQNIKRRAERDVENAHKYGVERFLQNMLPVVDSIEKAIEASESSDMKDDDPIFEGIKLCRKLLVDVLTRENVEAIDPEGEPFDPNLHEALTTVPNPDVEPNTVVTVVQKGYKLNDRLVRPAMVMVSKNP